MAFILELQNSSSNSANTPEGEPASLSSVSPSLCISAWSVIGC